MSGGTLHVFVAAAEPADGRTATGVVFIDHAGRALRKVGRALPGVADRGLAAFHGIVYALWNSRRLGSRRVVVHCAERDIVAQINGEAEVPEQFVGPYLEVRALLHAYRAARVERCPLEAGDLLWQAEAQALAGAAIGHDIDETVEDLPLWARTETRSSA